MISVDEDVKVYENANWESDGHKVSRETTIWGFADDRNHDLGWAATNTASELFAIWGASTDRTCAEIHI